MFEELDHVLEDEMLKLAGRIHASFEVRGKLSGHTTTRGENTIDDIAQQLLEFFGLKSRSVDSQLPDSSGSS